MHGSFYQNRETGHAAAGMKNLFSSDFLSRGMCVKGAFRYEAPFLHL
jgi:hypothetical protein